MVETSSDQIFSTSVMKLLRTIEEHPGADFITVVEELFKIHKEYGHEDLNLYYDVNRRATGPKFLKLLSFLQKFRSYNSLRRRTSDEWSQLVLSIARKPEGKVINGRLFLLAIILSEFDTIHFPEEDEIIDNTKQMMA